MNRLDAITPLLEAIAGLCGIAFQVRHHGQAVLTTSSFDGQLHKTAIEATIAEFEARSQPFHQTLKPAGITLYGAPLESGPGARNWLLAIAPADHWESRREVIQLFLDRLIDLSKNHLAGAKEIDELAIALDGSYEELALYRRLQKSFRNGIPSASDMSEIISGLRDILNADMVLGHFPENPDLNITISSAELPDRLDIEKFAKGLKNGIISSKTAINNHYFIMNNSLKEPVFSSLSKRPFRLITSQVEYSGHIYGWLSAVSFNFYTSFKRNHLNMLQATASQAALVCANIHLLKGLESLSDQVKTFKSELPGNLSQPSPQNDPNSHCPSDFLDKAFSNLSKSIEATKTLMLRGAQMATMGQMSAVFAHEIKQPLCALDGFVQIATLNASTSDQSEDLKKMAKAIRRIHHIVKRFESFTRPHQSQFKPLLFNPIVREVYQLMRPQLELKGIEAKFQRAANLPKIEADAQGLQQAVLNLVSNAIQAMASKNDDHPELRLETYRDSQHVCLDVTDNGPGISEDHLDKVIEPYFTTKNSAQGTGLGLSVVADIVDQHKGLLEIKSTPGKGSRFTIKIPAHTQQHLPG